MAVTHYTLTAKFTDLLGAAYNPNGQAVTAWIETNVAADEGIVDDANNLIELGPQRQKAASDGTVVFANLIGSDSAAADINIATGTLQYRVTAEYINALTRKRGQRWTSGWFSLTANTNLADVVAEQYVPAEFITQATADLQAMIDQGLQGPQGDPGPQGAPGGSDAATAGFVSSGPLTGAALLASFAGISVGALAAGGTARYLKTEHENLRDTNELWVGDSLDNGSDEMVYLLTQQRATLNPTRSYDYVLVDQSTGASWNTTTHVQVGTGTANAGGPFKTTIYNFSVPGVNLSYGQGSRYALLLATNWDLIVNLQGKNEGSTAGGSTDAHWRGSYLAATETWKRDFPTADIVCVLQIPNRDDTDMAKKNRVYNQIAALRGYGIIDMHQFWIDNLAAITGVVPFSAGWSAAVTPYYKTDGLWIHPTTAADAPNPDASSLMTSWILPFFTYDKRTGGSVRAQGQSSFEEVAEQLLDNGDMLIDAGGLLTGFEVSSGMTVSKDFRAGYFEPETGKGYGVRLQTTGLTGVAEYVRMSFDAAFRAKWAGKPITASIRMRCDTKTPTDSTTQGRFGWSDGVQAAVNSPNYAYARDGFHWRVLTFTLGTSPVYDRFTIWADSNASKAGDITVDRIRLVSGILPRKGTKGTPGAAGAPGAAGDASATQIDFCSTVGSNPVVAALAIAGTAGVLTATANAGTLCQFKPHRNMTIALLEWYVGGASAGNYDIALMNSSGTRLWSKGSTAFPLANATQQETVSPPVALVAGQTYYVLISADNTTATIKGINTANSNTAPGSGAMRLLDGTGFARVQGSVFPIPSSITISSTGSGKVPVVVLREA